MVQLPGPWTERQQQALTTAPNPEKLLAGPASFSPGGLKEYSQGTANDAALFLDMANARHELNKLLETPGNNSNELLGALAVSALMTQKTSWQYRQGIPKEEREERDIRLRSITRINALAGILERTDSGGDGAQAKFSISETEDAESRRVFRLGGKANVNGETRVTILEEIPAGDTVEITPLGTVVGLAEDGNLQIENPAYTLWKANENEGGYSSNPQPEQFLAYGSAGYKQVESVCDGAIERQKAGRNATIDLIGALVR